MNLVVILYALPVALTATPNLESGHRTANGSRIIELASCAQIVEAQRFAKGAFFVAAAPATSRILAEQVWASWL